MLLTRTARVVAHPKRHVSCEDHTNPVPRTVTHVSAVALLRGEIEATSGTTWYAKASPWEGKSTQLFDTRTSTPNAPSAVGATQLTSTTEIHSAATLR